MKCMYFIDVRIHEEDLERFLEANIVSLYEDYF